MQIFGTLSKFYVIMYIFEVIFANFFSLRRERGGGLTKIRPGSTKLGGRGLTPPNTATKTPSSGSRPALALHLIEWQSKERRTIFTATTHHYGADQSHDHNMMTIASNHKLFALETALAGFDS
jgi:hypothetical protein